MKIFIVILFIAVMASAGCSRSKPAAQSGPAKFSTPDGKTITASYSKSARNLDTVTLVLPDNTKATLYRARSGSGTRYTNDTAEWWEHQGEATYTVSHTTVFRGNLAR